MLIFCDGFDHYQLQGLNVSEGLFTLSKWTYYQTAGPNAFGPTCGIQIQPGNGRPSTTDTLTGGCQLRTASGTAGNGSANTVYTELFKYLNANLGTFYFGAAYNLNFAGVNGTNTTSDIIIAQFFDGTTEQFDLRLTNYGVLYVTNNGTQIGRAAIALTLGIWNYIEVGATINSSGSIIVRVNGISVINVTGVNNRGSSNNYINGIAVTLATPGNVGQGAGQIEVDDVYVCDNTTSYCNTFLGDIRIRAVFPYQNGTLDNFATTASLWASGSVTTQYSVIEDLNGNAQYAIATTSDAKTGSTHPTWATSPGVSTTDNHVTWECLGPMAQWNVVQESNPDGDTSYIIDNNLGDIQTFKFSSVTGTTVFAVALQMWARKDDAGFRSIRAFTLSNSVTGDSGSDLALSNSYIYETGFLMVDPSTSVPWTISGLNAAEFGLKITV